MFPPALGSNRCPLGYEPKISPAHTIIIKTHIVILKIWMSVFKTSYAGDHVHDLHNRLFVGKFKPSSSIDTTRILYQ